MPLVECPECDHPVSDQASSCPHCGHPLAEDTKAGAPTPSTKTPSTYESVAATRGWITIVSGFLVTAGSLLPWRTATLAFLGTVNISGTEGDGMITLVLGIVIMLGGAVVVSQGSSTIGALTALAAGGLALWITYVSFQSTLTVVELVNSGGTGRASVGLGLWLVAIGSTGSIVGAGGSLEGSVKAKPTKS
ncbi:MAG: zinc ribbon domain-containing protein [Actinobacteria bacterium]|nr:zinc ribbon domain-containing protein [Actinomycetota bacterium]